MLALKNEAEALKRSSWPKCDVLAKSLAEKGKDAIPALEYALTSRTHHVRSACLRAINLLDPNKARELAQQRLADRAYEVRETAATILGVPVPK